ncbi:flagellar filament capping protein FliD [Modestobacter lapidis]|nr:flagellar filament capping protein FliD [Modestobacter lapidis]
MAGMNVGLISGMDTASLIGQLMQVEANPQTLLKRKLAETQNDAAAYREVNTKFDALRDAAELLTRTTTWAAATASSSSTAVTVTAAPGATAGSVSFGVTSLAAKHAVFSSDAPWAATTTAFGPTSLTLTPEDTATPATTIAIPAGATLGEAVTTINDAGAGVTAALVNTGSGYRLQLTSTAAGAASEFAVTGLPTTVLTQASDAKLRVGTDAVGYDVTSTTNTFKDLMPGVTLTVSQTGGPVTVGVASDPEAVATAVESLVAAANAVLTNIDKHTSTKTGSIAVLKGDSTLRGLTGKVLEAVSYAIGGASAAQAGIQLTRDGEITFTKATFIAALESSPALAQQLVNGTPAAGTDPAVPGVAQRLTELAKNATNFTSGTLTLKANSTDSLASDLQDRIEDWDRRLAIRESTLTRQFTAMETALSSLQNQSAWLSSQVSSLPSWSSSSD